jgi:hypothetical protein
MTVTPPPGYGLYTQTFTVTGGAHKQVITAGFANVGAQTAFNCRVNLSNAFNGAGGLTEPSQYDSSLTQVQTYVLLNTGGVLTSDLSTVAAVGTATFNTPSPGTSIVILRRTAMAGRQYRGHIALPAGFIDETEVNEAGFLLPGTVTSIQTKASFTLGRMTTLLVPMVLLHSPPLSGPLPAPTAVTSLSVTNLVGSQRRRLRG